MKKIRTLQEQFKQGKITKEEYIAELKKLLDDDFVDHEEYDEAASFDPEEDKPIFTQADVDRMVVAKATKLVRKTLKDAGVELDASNKDLLTKVTELVKAGQSTEGGEGKATDADLAKLRQLEGKLPGLEGKIKDLAIENAVLKGLGGKLKAVNPVQVVRALKSDYMDFVEIDEETGDVTAKSIETALKRISASEPNLFTAVESNEDFEENLGSGGFKGKGPGGGAGGAGKASGDLAKKKEEAKAMLANAGIKFNDNK